MADLTREDVDKAKTAAVLLERWASRNCGKKVNIERKTYIDLQHIRKVLEALAP